VEKLGLMLLNTRRPMNVTESIKRAIVSVTGVTPKADWQWRDWAKACGLDPEKVFKALPLEPESFGWVTLMIPAGWEGDATSATGTHAPGTPRIAVVERSDQKLRARGWKPVHRSLKEMVARRIRDLAMRDVGGGRWVRRPGVVLDLKTPSYRAGVCRTSSFRITDPDTRRTTFYMLGWLDVGKLLYYMEASFSADADAYADYAFLFERRIARTLRVKPGPPERVKPIR
jgi:hypothetical protein